MATIYGVDLSPKKIDILKSILMHRGITAEQLYLCLPPSKKRSSKPDNPKKPVGRDNVYQYLRRLSNDGLVSAKTLKTDSRSEPRTYYYLTNDGLEVINNVLDIPLGYRGNGYKSENGVRDYGDFPYEKYLPPSGRMQHHFLLVDLFIKLDQLSQLHPELAIDYRDNRYVSEPFAWQPPELVQPKPKTFIFRPDGEVRIGDKYYWVEIDKGTEYLDGLKDKFEGYARFMEHIAKEARTLPEGILFITDDKDNNYGFRRRWQTIQQAFFGKMGEWTTQINLIAGSVGEIERIIRQEVSQPERFNSLIKTMGYYFKGERYNGTELKSVGTAQGLTFEPAIFSITQKSETHQLYMYERMNGYETRPIARLLAFSTWLNENREKASLFSMVKNVIPVLYHFDAAPVPLSFDWMEDKEQAVQLFRYHYWLNLQDNKPIWLHEDLEPLTTGNPLILHL